MQGETTMKLNRTTPIAGLVIAAAFAALTLAPNSAMAGESKRSGQMHLTKDCTVAPPYAGAAGDQCTIIASDYTPIQAYASRIFYDQAAGTPAGLLDSNVVLDAGDGNRAVGRCTLDFGTLSGLCTFSDGTGSFKGFQARLDVKCTPSSVCSMDGTFSVASKEDR
jgi:hypothetical protein